MVLVKIVVNGREYEIEMPKKELARLFFLKD